MHATGSGKTYTAMCAIRSEIERGSSVLVVVPSIDLLYQWAKEIGENIALPDLRVLLCGGGNNAWRNRETLFRWTQKNPKSSTIVLSTMDTAVTVDFLRNIADGNHLFIVADEVHRLGSFSRRRIFQLSCGSNLGLSATPKRYGDPDGTEEILTYFGGILQPPYTLRDAINAGVLTRYFYDPYTVTLYEDEQNEWDVLSEEVGKMIARSSALTLKDIMEIPGLKMKLLARARILKNAQKKPEKALQIIKDCYQKGQRWIIYCDNQIQLGKVLNLLIQHGYDAYEYHSDMLGDREQTLLYFEHHGGLLVSIRCLDEGVDIPSTTHALILASSKNPREFIQRRGRVLRKHPNKYYAYLFDVLVLPNLTSVFAGQSSQSSIVASEIARAIQFGEMAENPSCISVLRNIAVDFGLKLEEVIEGGIEDGE